MNHSKSVKNNPDFFRYIPLYGKEHLGKSAVYKACKIIIFVILFFAFYEY